MTRTSAAGHPLHQAVSFLFLSFYCIFLYFLFFLRQCFSFSSFLLRSLFPFVLLLSSLCFVSSVSFSNFFLPSFLKTPLVLALLLLISSCFLLFSELFLFFNLFFELLCKNLSLLLFSLVSFFVFCVYVSFVVSRLFFCCLQDFVNIVLSDSSSFKCVSFPSFFDSLF